ncbi:ATP-binding protein [Acanthopleuribacter pedis]|uniref:histidine kinase n=1 Tax=Acanthopleuribacter pedis TaxID=442870 RepID=A0A8J7U2G3_9BACT|nr:ATP-binding protein [Acanthopleuribacter pedis]MBO1317684.1 response regulator [Acanthopleuribacter pedis]
MRVFSRSFFALGVLLPCLSLFAALPPTHLRFKNYPLDHGFAGTQVFDIFCDNNGLIWMASEDGLSLYDGTNITVFRGNPQNPNALFKSWVRKIAQDPGGDLWLATRGGGLHRMDYTTQQFRSFRHDPGRDDSLSHDDLYNLALSRDGRVWVCSYRGGLDRFDPITETFERINLAALFPGVKNPTPVYTVFEDSRGFLNIGTFDDGLLRWHPETGETHRIPRHGEEGEPVIPQVILSFFERPDGLLWIGTNGFGLFQLDPETMAVTHLSAGEHAIPAVKPYKLELDRYGNLWIADLARGLMFRDQSTGEMQVYAADPDNPFSLASQALMSLTLDVEGGVWVGSSGAGVSWADPHQKPFENALIGKDFIANSGVNASAVDDQGRLWIGNRAAGIFIADPETHHFLPYDKVTGLPPLVTKQIKTLVALPGNKMGVGFWRGGLQIIDLNTGTDTHFAPGASVATSVSPSIGHMVAEGTSGLWVGGYHGGLYYLDLAEGTAKQIRDSETAQKVAGLKMSRMRRAADGSLWMGTIGGGLYRYQPSTGDWDHWHKERTDGGHLRANDVLDIHIDSQGRVWIVGVGVSLSRIEPVSGNVTTWDFANGLTVDSFSNILQDGDGRLWLTGAGNVTLFDTRWETVRVFDREDGIAMSGVAEQGAVAAADGTFYAFSGNTFLRFRSQTIPLSGAQPKVFLHDIRVAAKSLARREGLPQPVVLQAPLGRVPLATERLTLSHEQRMIAFDFNAVHFNRPDKIRYRYRLEGFDDAWFETSAKNAQAAFSNLDAGSYRFEVQASNEDGQWSPHISGLDLTVLPPLWLTWWAKTGYVFIVLLLIAVYLWQQRGKLEGQRQIAQQEKELAHQARLNAEKDRALAEEAQKVAARLGQLDKLKDEFLANTSHELRTPLQGIIGMAESLADGSGSTSASRMNNSLGILINEGRRLAHLVNDLLDFSQLRHQKLALDMKAVDLRAAADLVVALTLPRLQGTPVTLTNRIPADCPLVAADENRLQQIIHNLVGNAVKFTDQGSITIEAEMGPQQVTVAVRDTGIGIASEKLAGIFNSFEQGDGSASRARGGTGLGLSITKALVGEHGGELRISSEPGVGSVFSFSLPVADEVDRARQIGAHAVPVLMEPVVGAALETTLAAPEVVELEDSLHVLVVDDEPINRHVLRNHLEGQGYRVTTVTHGQEALALLDTDAGTDVDLILLDIMMPGLTGYEVASRVRERYALQDLPIIFLTAKTGLADLVAAFQYGGNDFLPKPVAKEELLTRIRSQHHLLDLHRNLEDKVKRRTKQLAERTREVELQHRELQHVYRILRTLNGLARLDEIFEALLYHGLQLFEAADRAALMVRDGGVFRFAALVGHESAEAEALSQVQLSWEQLVQRYVQSGQEVGDGIYRLDDVQTAAPLMNLELTRASQSLVVLALKIEAKVEGFLVFSNVRQTLAFGEVAVQRLARFREHATAALTRARLLNEIEKQKEEIVRNQEIIVRQEKLASLGIMTAGIAHEINNPNNFIAGGSESLLDEFGDFHDFLLTLLGDEPDPDFVDAFQQRFARLDEQVSLIRVGSKRIGKIVGDLLRLTQLDDGAATGVNLLDCVSGARRGVASLFPETTFVLEIDAGLYLDGQAEAFEHVFGHLLSNAGEAIKKAGHGAGRVVVKAVDQPTRTVITVTDNGVGISPVAQRKLFDAFYTTGEVGAATGLGLFTSHQIIKGCGGDIRVTSQLGRGTTFSVTLPKRGEMEAARQVEEREVLRDPS